MTPEKMYNKPKVVSNCYCTVGSEELIIGPTTKIAIPLMKIVPKMVEIITPMDFEMRRVIHADDMQHYWLLHSWLLKIIYFYSLHYINKYFKQSSMLFSYVPYFL